MNESSFVVSEENRQIYDESIEYIKQMGLEESTEWAFELWGKKSKNKNEKENAEETEINIDDMINLLSIIEKICEKEYTGYFQYLTEQKIDLRSVIANLSTLIMQRNQEKIKMAYLSAHIYISMLCIKGSSKIEVFHPTVVCYVFELLRDYPIYCRVNPNQTESKKQSKKKKPTKGKKKKEIEIKEDGDEEDEDELSDNLVEDTTMLSMVITLLRLLQTFLTSFPLANHQECVTTAISGFTEIARFNLFASHSKEQMKKISKSNVNSFIEENNPIEISIFSLKLLLSPDHGDVEEIFKYTLSRLVPNIILNYGDIVPTIQKHKLLTRNYSLQFITYFYF